jgi:hypothetical protein
VLSKILEAAREVEVSGGTEEDLKVRVENILWQHVWSRLGVPRPRYEYPVGAGTYAASYGRVDALYGLTVFEYKRPGALRTRERDEAVNKLKNVYIPKLLGEDWVRDLLSRARQAGLSPRLLGVILDGYGVVFVEYHVETGEFRVEPSVGFYDLRSERGVDYIRRVIRSVLATYRKKIDARVLASDFGYQSGIAKKAVRALYRALTNPRSERTRRLFEEWLKAVSQAYPISGEELRKIAELYGFKGDELKEVDGVRLFYAIQTYYSIVLKLLAAEVAARFHDSAASTYIRALKDATGSPEKLREELLLLESGAVYSWYGIKNFLEGEVFSWYLDEWSDEIYAVLRDVIDKLDEYDVEALTLDLKTARDMFKLLYEELVPRKEVRQKLGIYSTPDWLAELVLDELGLTVERFLEMKKKGLDPLDLRVLDPGVGTGTFLSLVIQRLGEYLRRSHEHVGGKVASEALKKITSNVVGFDIDALAVLTARTNYMIALAVVGLLEHKGSESIEIPIYMANSVVTAEELKESVLVDVGGRLVTVEVVRVPTAIGDFQIPSRLVETKSVLQLLSDLRDPLESGYGADHAVVRGIIGKYRLSEAEEKLVRDLYSRLLDLKNKGVDGVWIPVIKSHVVPVLYKNSFDYVVGNPPWIAYRYIANPDYQAKVKHLAKDVYRLVTSGNLITHMEMATLFFVRCLDLYLRDNGMIGFVMPKSIFSADQHDAFRRGSVARVRYQFELIIDLEGVEPLFYVPTCAIIAQKVR